MPAVIFDTDVDFDDTVALAALAQQHLRGTIDLRAVTVTNNGGGLPGKAYQHARCLLDSLGLHQIPVADATYSLPHAFPDISSHDASTSFSMHPYPTARPVTFRHRDPPAICLRIP